MASPQSRLSGLFNLAAAHDLTPSTSLARLLDDADEQERLLANPSEVVPSSAAVVRRDASQPFERAFQQALRASGRVSTAAPAAPVPADHVDHVLRPAETRPPVPPLTTAPGDLVVIAGMREDALTAARALAVLHPGIALCVSGTLTDAGLPRVGGRRQALQTRADGVQHGAGALVAMGLGQTPQHARQHARPLGDLAPDQVWVAVDVTRKPEDTVLWVAAVAATAGRVDAVAVLCADLTSTPDSVRALGLPVGWIDANTAIPDSRPPRTPTGSSWARR